MTRALEALEENFRARVMCALKTVERRTYRSIKDAQKAMVDTLLSYFDVDDSPLFVDEALRRMWKKKGEPILTDELVQILGHFPTLNDDTVWECAELIVNFIRNRQALQPPDVDRAGLIVYSEHERDGMMAAYNRAREKGKGDYESLFAVATFILRERAALTRSAVECKEDESFLDLVDRLHKEMPPETLNAFPADLSKNIDAYVYGGKASAVDVEALKRKVPQLPTKRLARPCELNAINNAKIYNQAIDDLYQRGLPGQIPEGFALVPVEPTVQQMEAVTDILLLEEATPLQLYQRDGFTDCTRRFYKAMIQAAQQKENKK